MWSVISNRTNPQKKLLGVFFLVIFTVVLIFYDQFSINLEEYRYIFSQSELSSNQSSQSLIILFDESELPESDSFPPKAVLMGRSRGYGLGNHLFSYAECYALSRNLKIPLVLPLPPSPHNDSEKNVTDREFVLDHFSLPKGIFVDYKEIQKKKTYRAKCQMAKDVSLIPKDVLNNTNYYSTGFCFSDSSFKEFEKELQQIKVKVENPSESYLKWKELITSTEWGIAVHVRKQDIEKQYWSAPPEYFQEALRIVKQKTPEEVQKQVFVFSDDIDWAKEALIGVGLFPAELGLNMYFISSSFGGLTNVEEMDLMIRCKSIIISNSTFSWWAAYLMKNTGNHKKIVVRPQFNATKHKNDSLGWHGKKRRNYAVGYPKEWIALDT